MSWGVVLYAQAEDMAKAFVVAGSMNSEAENMSQRHTHRETCQTFILPVPGPQTSRWYQSLFPNSPTLQHVVGGTKFFRHNLPTVKPCWLTSITSLFSACLSIVFRRIYFIVLPSTKTNQPVVSWFFRFWKVHGHSHPNAQVPSKEEFLLYRRLNLYMVW